MRRYESLTWSMALLLVVIMAGCGGNGGGIPNSSSSTPPDAPGSLPWMSSTSPPGDATGVGTNAAITAAFSKDIDPSTITGATFVVTGPGAASVPGTASGYPRHATFTPSSPLASGTRFTATVTTGVQDLRGHAMPHDFAWSFTTGLGPDTTPPTVVAVQPVDGATGVATAPLITATFSEAMDPTTVTRETFTLKQGTTPIPCNVSCVTYGSASKATCSPRRSLAPNTPFTVRLEAGVRDVAGNPLPSSPFAWSFSTGPPGDTTAPTVNSKSPPDAATGVSFRKAITATFSEPMAPRTITTDKFILSQGAKGSTRVVGVVTYAGLKATFTPQRRLAPCTTYTATITDGVTDLAGNALATASVWSFTTGLEPVPLRSAASFAVLAYATVTNTALLTTVNGDLGVSPGTAVTGAPVVHGAIHAGDAVAAQAQLDVTAAYNDAFGRTCSPVDVTGVDLGGKTLTPGLYKSTSSLGIAAGALTLDAQGDPDAVFIFQSATSLITADGTQVILIGGAQAANIYWQLGSSATLGKTSVFKGNIRAYASVWVHTGARMAGRLLARTGEVTLDGTTSNRP